MSNYKNTRIILADIPNVDLVRAKQDVETIKRLLKATPDKRKLRETASVLRRREVR